LTRTLPMKWLTLTSSRLLSNGGFLRPIEYTSFTAQIDWDNDQPVADFQRKNLANGPSKGVAVYQDRPDPFPSTHFY
jgi:hypothetical protein